MANLFPNPVDDSSLFDKAIIDGVITPGLIVISGGKKPYGWDEKKGYGQSGATIVFTGEGLIEFDVELTFIDGVDGQTVGQQIDDYYSNLAPVLLKVPTKNDPAAHSFFHPLITVDLNCPSVVVTEVGQLKEKDAGVWSVSFKCKEFRPPKPATAKASGSKGWEKAKTNAEDASDAQIRDLLDQAKSV